MYIMGGYARKALSSVLAHHKHSSIIVMLFFITDLDIMFLLIKSATYLFILFA